MSFHGLIPLQHIERQVANKIASTVSLLLLLKIVIGRFDLPFPPATTLTDSYGISEYL
jgi:hypothetical protein